MFAAMAGEKNLNGSRLAGNHGGTVFARRESHRDVLEARSAIDELRAEIRQPSRAKRFIRPGFLLIAIFELACIVVGVRAHPAFGVKTVPFELFNLFAGFVCLSFIWTLFFDHHWRATVFNLCATILTIATSVGLLTGRTEPLFMSAMLLMVGAGSLVPWNDRWQAALTALCLGWMALNAICVPAAQDGLYPWLGLLGIAGLAHLATMMKERYRTDLQSEVRVTAGELLRARVSERG